MPLVIENSVVKSTVFKSFCPGSFFETYEELQKKSKEFIQQELSKNVLLEKSDRVLYVLQREFATISDNINARNLTYIASDDATTCHIVVIQEKTTGTVSLGHFDGYGTEAGLHKMLKELVEVCRSVSGEAAKPSFNLCIFGGFQDEKNYSCKLLRDLLMSSCDADHDIHLDLVCSYSINNTFVNNRPCPLIYGVAVDIKTNKITIAKCMYKAPDIVLRETRIMYGNREPMVGVYDYKLSRIVIRPFLFSYPSYAKQLLHLPDNEYLDLMSTSPHCEPSHFVQSSKAALHFAMTYAKSVKQIFCDKPREYVLNASNEWILQDSEQMSL